MQAMKAPPEDMQTALEFLEFLQELTSAGNRAGGD